MLAWLPWTTEAFQRAHRGGRPVLLSIVTGWSAACAEMDADVFGDAAVVEAVAAHAVLVRVDADQRPDIADRYGLGGWPTTVWLTPEGEMLRGGTYLDVETLVRTLVDVDTRFQRDRAGLLQQAAAARAARSETPRAAEPMTLDQIRECLLQEFDVEYGGFGHGPKFPIASPLLFALRAGVLAGDAELIAIANLTLDRIADSEMTDAETGAFTRACAARDWTTSDRACLLDVQADMIAVYLEAWHLLKEDRYRTRAIAGLEYVDRALRERGRENGAFCHYEGGAILTDSNARLIRTLVYASHVLGDNHWILAAVDIAERLLTIVYAPASGVAHCLRPAAATALHATTTAIALSAEANPRPSSARAASSATGADGDPQKGAAATSAEAPARFTNVRTASSAPEADDAAQKVLAGASAGGVRRGDVAVTFGLLADAILMASALLDLGEAAGQQVYVELAEELGRFCLRRFWDGGAGALVDRLRTTAGAGDVGLLGDSLRPFEINVEAARLLQRLAGRTGDPVLAARAGDVRRYVSVMACHQGILSANYGLLLLELGQSA